ncbi:ABC transporter substrate-binding protein [Gulosibacter macacae]|uniref:ABC transporter substrate-binding protein n=1 Tax=Gulosibacter macacae TaxID=2488791 RepID=A0A3P3VW20_9MICO|nr:ABC transporter substrate-binding protein [Gulosibacter macacae]RRJ86995.1 ABC transporter substrate-binding protein [Gulosibacter macacae]
MTNPLLRRGLRAVAVAAAATLALAGCQAGAGEPGGSAPAGPPITIGLTYTPNVQFAPFYVADELGYFDEAGVAVELRHHGESESLFGALEAGTEQLVYGGGDEIVQAVAGEVPITSVATIYTTYPAVLIVPADSPIQTAADLAGHSVGTPGPYGQTWFALQALLDRAGLSASDVDVQHIGYTQQAALSSGKVDAVMGFSNNDAIQFEANGFPVRVIDAVDPAAPTLVGPALGASTTLVTERADDVTAILDALERAIEYVSANPAETIDIAAKYIPTLTTADAKAAALATLEATIPLMKAETGQQLLFNDPTVWESMCEFMPRAGLIEKQVDCAATFTNDLLPKK